MGLIVSWHITGPDIGDTSWTELNQLIIQVIRLSRFRFSRGQATLTMITGLLCSTCKQKLGVRMFGSAGP